MSDRVHAMIQLVTLSRFLCRQLFPMDRSKALRPTDRDCHAVEHWPAR